MIHSSAENRRARHLSESGEISLHPMIETVAKRPQLDGHLLFRWDEKTSTGEGSNDVPQSWFYPVLAQIYLMERLKEKLAKSGGAMVLLAEVSPPGAREETRRLTSFG